MLCECEVSTSVCGCAKRIAAAESELRAKGKASPGLEERYFAAAAEMVKIGCAHFADCERCRQETPTPVPEPSALSVVPAMFGAETVQAVSARAVHATLNVGKDFTSWLKSQFERGRFAEGVDWVLTQKGVNPQGGRPQHDYLLSVDCAKHICMLSGTDRGHQAREHFLLIERAYRSQQPTVQTLLEDPTSLRALVSGLADQTMQAQAQIAALAPKAAYADALADATGSVTIQEAAKVLGLGPNGLFDFLRKQHLLMPGNVPYQRHVDAGRFRVTLKTYTKPDGEVCTRTRPWLTPKGIQYVQRLLSVTIKAEGTAVAA